MVAANYDDTQESTQAESADSSADVPDGESRKKLLLIDGMALAYRAHFALIRSPRFTTDGRCTSAVFGVLATLQDVIKREVPTHIAVAFDTADPTARHELFPEYKAQRDEMPEDISKQLPLIDQLFEAYGIQIIRMPGYEADDIIGTLAHEAGALGFESLMLTPDKDYDQLVTEQIRVLKPGRKGGEAEILGVTDVLEKWAVERIDQVIDVLGLMGDSSDNIPGIPGIGPKTAQKLIAQFGSIEQLIERSDELKGKQKERVQAHVEQALLSKQLVTIQLDVPHAVDIQRLGWSGIDEDKLRRLMEELEFDTLGRRIFGRSFSSANSRAEKVQQKREQEVQDSLFDADDELPKFTSVKQEYSICESSADRHTLLEKLQSVSEFAFYIETLGRSPRASSLAGVAFCVADGQASFVPLPDSAKEAKRILAEFQGVFSNPQIGKLGHHLKHSLTALKWLSIDFDGRLFDTMLAHSMKEPDMSGGLDYLSKLYLQHEIQNHKEVASEATESLFGVAKDRIAAIANERVDVSFRIAKLIRPVLQKYEVAEVCNDVECPLVPVLVAMEHEGIRLDMQALENYAKVLRSDIKVLEAKIFEAAGHAFNIDSPKQLGIVLYDELQIEKKPKKTSTGQYSTREAELERLANRHEIIPMILDYRNAVKLKSVYVDQLPAAVHSRTGRLHTDYDQTRIATGRIQSNKSKSANHTDSQATRARDTRSFRAA